MNATYTVAVPAIDGRTVHSTHQSYRDAVDQADMVHGHIEGDEAAYRYAHDQQGFTGSYQDWTAQDDDERAEYELGMRGFQPHDCDRP